MGRGVWKYFIRFILTVPILIIVVIYLFFQFSPLYSRLKVDIILAEYGVIEGVVEVKAFVHRQENAYDIPTDGQLRWNVQAGQRVARNQKLADVIISDEDQSLVLQQQLINMRLQTLTDGGDLYTYSVEALGEIDRQMRFLLSDISYNIKNSQYELAFQNQSLLNEMTAQKHLVSIHQQLPVMSRDELEQQKAMIEGRLNNITHEIRAEDSGYFALGDDGWENIIGSQPDEKDVSKVRDFVKTHSPDTHVDMDTNHFRIIYDHRWHMFLPLEKVFAAYYEGGQRILLRIEGTDHEVRARIIEQYSTENEDEVILMVEMDQFINDWKNVRFYQVNVIYQRQEGLLVPVSAVMEEDDGSKSVYKIDVNGYAVKMQVLELTKNETTAVLKEGPITVPSDDAETGEKQVESIRQYDEVITNPDSVTERQKVR